MKEVKDELREGDQILVKVLAIEGNRIKLSRKAVLREQRAKLGLPEQQPNASASPYEAPSLATTAEEPEIGDEEDFEEAVGDLDDEEPNFNRADDVPVVAGVNPPPGGATDGGQRRPGGGGRRRRGGRRPGAPGGAPPRASGGQ